MTEAELKAALEAIVYVAEEPVALKTLLEVFPDETKEHLQAVIEQLKSEYATDERGLEIRQVAGGLKMSTKPQHHDCIKKFAKTQQPPVKLSLSALETLAVIAYKQPVTLPEIQEIRGVNASSVIHTLLEKKLISTAGRKQVIGRPILYKTTKEFLLHFGLNDLNELPTLKEFEEIVQHSLPSVALGASQADAENISPAEPVVPDASAQPATSSSEEINTIASDAQDTTTQ